MADTKLTCKLDDIDPAFDSAGYPHDKFLAEISGCEVRNYDDCEKLLQIVRGAWQYADYWTVIGRKHVLATGGWSGNEELIGALRENFIFWSLCWHQSSRGGGYIFATSKEDCDDESR